MATDPEIAFNRLITAHHEAGHAIAHLVAGGRVQSVKIISTYHGVMTPREHEPAPDNVLGWLVMILAGHEAAARYVAKNGYGLGTARRLTRDGAASDLAGFRRFARGTGISEAHARREAARLVSRHWGRVHRAALRLDKAGRLSGSQL
ncbi:Peptidase M50B-like [Amycolatopsis sacchari]|uniref:Peptidase M50B-like n=1 Tax=Amycolatopsis sacchari TaxID=115433 RepID=A0A1I3TZ59_9PSEU|nr:M50 family metallopeptidase [Amycolatopsis sacchari]SFJ76554.1 Peptidase M50B-like [Amycolatopsis sacchari]